MIQHTKEAAMGVLTGTMDFFFVSTRTYLQTPLQQPWSDCITDFIMTSKDLFRYGAMVKKTTA